MNNRKYLLLIAFLILGSFVSIAFFINDRLSKTVSDISASLTGYQHQQKAAFYRDQFNVSVETITTAENLLREAETVKDVSLLYPALTSTLFSDKKIVKIWYSVISGRDSSFKSFKRDTSGSVVPVQSDFVKSWVDRVLVNPLARNDTNSEFLNFQGRLHWLLGRRLLLADGTQIAFGFDIDLLELQNYFRQTDYIWQSYAFITTLNNLCISHPDEQMIGRKILTRLSVPELMRRLKKNYRISDTVVSSYLNVPVIRYYSFLTVGSEQWLFVMDTPVSVIDEDAREIRNYILAIGICCVFLVITIVILAQKRWQRQFLLRQQAENTQKELVLENQVLEIISEKQQKENALLQLGKLKEKINPHFLFNSLLSLNGLISQDPEQAKEFVVRLSKVYRYVLNDFPDGLSTLDEEIRFAEQYSFLLQIRFGEALQLHQADLQHIGPAKIPFLSIQSAIENAVKHNIVSRSNPLTITVTKEGDCLVVSNNLQLRKDKGDSSGQGWAYIENIYKHYGIEHFKHGMEGNTYKCYLPLIYYKE
ncbi:histidine kinase [Desertivirga xinjiangensis]|uniref:histidine kinase n=1 Tax=Desertivirga xinjiangensis TaxID=539206 RepID=UPI00210E52BD|nr:histidine kinase [Pedobacter xinjiangensis]